MNNWTKDWPKKLGTYWFYGWPYGRTHVVLGNMGSEPIPPELNLVRVRKCSNGTLTVREGHFWDKNEGAIGLFCEAVIPELPDVSGMVPKVEVKK